MATDAELEHASEVADARLGVAEDFAWVVAALAFTCVYLKWDSVLLGIAVAIAGFIISILPSRREAASAEDAYFRQARIGKYYEDKRGTDA